MSRTLLSLAGFQVITIGRFWVIAEASVPPGCSKAFCERPWRRTLPEWCGGSVHRCRWFGDAEPRRGSQMTAYPPDSPKSEKILPNPLLRRGPKQGLGPHFNGITLPTSRLPVTDLRDGIDSAWPTTLPVVKPDKAARQTLPNPGKPHRSGPARQDTG